MTQPITATVPPGESPFPSVTGTPYSRAWYHSLRAILGESGCRQLGFYEIPPAFLLSVVIPVFDERETIEALLERVRMVPIRKEIIVVDDCSRDGTRELLQELVHRWPQDDANGLRLALHDRNQGKGAALRTGFQLVRGDVAVVQDADLEYDPFEYPRLLQPIIEGKADVVYGSRFLGDQPHRVLHYWHYLGNKVLTTLSNCFTSLNLTDMETCYKLFTREVIQQIAPKLCQNRFGFEPEVTARVARLKCRVYELSIGYSGRTYDQGKKIGWKDGVSAIWCIIRYGLGS